MAMKRHASGYTYFRHPSAVVEYWPEFVESADKYSNSDKAREIIRILTKRKWKYFLISPAYHLITVNIMGDKLP